MVCEEHPRIFEILLICNSFSFWGEGGREGEVKFLLCVSILHGNHTKLGCVGMSVEFLKNSLFYL